MGIQQMLLGAGAAADPVYLDRVFEAALWEGNGSQRTWTNNIDLANEGGLVWIAQRAEDGDDAVMVDSERGVTKVLRANTNAAETTDSSVIDQFYSTGFRMGGSRNVNQSFSSGQRRYGCWTFRKAKHFFDVVKYDGDGTSSRQIAHGLGSAPGFMLVKAYNATVSWGAYHREAGNNKTMSINSYGDWGTDNNIWAATDPTDSHFTVGNSGYSNQSGRSYVVYLWGHGQAKFGENGDEKIIHCGKWTGSTSWQYIDNDFQSGCLMYKLDAGNATQQPRSHFTILDSMMKWEPEYEHKDDNGNMEDGEAMGACIGGGDGGRNTINGGRTVQNFEDALEPTPEGFRTKWSGNIATTDDFYYISIRERHGAVLDSTVTDGTKYYTADQGSGTYGDKPIFDAPNHLVDWVIMKRINSDVNGANGTMTAHRVQGDTNGGMELNEARNMGSTVAGIGTTSQKFWYHNGYHEYMPDHIATEAHAFMFKHSYGFSAFHYIGNGSNRMIRHGLAQAPKMVWVKRLDDDSGWYVYLAASGNTKYHRLDNVSDYGTNSGYWNNTDPTKTHMSLGSNSNVNANGGKFMMYSFGDSEINKVGTYTGNGSNSGPSITLGFVPRWLVIKKLEANSHWCMFENTYLDLDGSGNELMMFIDDDATKAEEQNFVNTTGNGFNLVDNDSKVNSNNSTYLYWAHK